MNYKMTSFACFTGYIVQAIVVNFVPLLFVMMQTDYGITLAQITSMITINFVIQLLTDMLSAGFVDKIGYRAAAVAAHIFAAAGLILLTILPGLFADAYVGIVISVVIYAVGGGLIEVLISPIIEACPSDNKEKAMSLLHSFYAWGQMGVVLLSTAFFAVFGKKNWKILTLLWAAIPVFNTFMFASVPIVSPGADGGAGLTIRQLFSSRAFRILMLMMMGAGASEQAVAQWASAFAEEGLGVNKTVGDLAGPMMFAALMGTSRLIFGKYGDRLDLDKFMKYSCVLCVVCYLFIALIPSAAAGLVGCAVCGFSVGILWPGTFSKAAAAVKGGTALFAMLALGGDMGCSLGPTLAGAVSSYFGNNLRLGILAAIIFPLVLLVCTLRPEVSIRNPKNAKQK